MANMKNGKYGVLEINHVAATRTGQIKAQHVPNATSFGTGAIENGMLLVVDEVAREITKPGTPALDYVYLHFSTEKIYDSIAKPGLNNFALFATGNPLPRMLKLNIGDTFTTNTVADGTGDDAVLVSAMATRDLAANPVFGVASADGNIALVDAVTTQPVVLKVVKYTTLPDGTTPALKFEVIKA